MAVTLILTLAGCTSTGSVQAPAASDPYAPLGTNAASSRTITNDEPVVMQADPYSSSAYRVAGNFPARPQLVTNLLLPMLSFDEETGELVLRSQTQVVTNTRHRATNFAALVLMWTNTSTAVAEYEVAGGHASGVTNWDFLAPASNNMVAMANPNPDAPDWFAVRLIDTFGNATAWSSNVFWNVRSNGNSYLENGAACLGWMATPGFTWRVTAIGSANPIFSVAPTNSFLAQVKLPEPAPTFYELTRQ